MPPLYISTSTKYTYHVTHVFPSIALDLKTIQKSLFKKRRQRYDQVEQKVGGRSGKNLVHPAKSKFRVLASVCNKIGISYKLLSTLAKPSSRIKPLGRPGAGANYSSRLLASSQPLDLAALQQELEPLLALVSPTYGYHQDLSQPRASSPTTTGKAAGTRPLTSTYAPLHCTLPLPWKTHHAQGETNVIIWSRQRGQAHAQAPANHTTPLHDPKYLN